MPPLLAACVYGAFILWLFYRYSKESGPVPSSLWIPFCWAAINATRPLANWFVDGTTASRAGDAAEGSFYDRNAYLFLMGAGLLVLARRRIEWSRIIFNCRWLILLYCYYLLSTLWSDYPFISLKRWVKSAGDIIVILVMLTGGNPVAAFRAVFVRCIYLLIPLSVLVVKYYPDIGRYTHQWTYQTYYCGLTLSKNALGLLALLGGLIVIWRLFDVYWTQDRRGLMLRKTWPDLLVLAMCLWLLKISLCATAVACFAVGTAIFFLSRLKWVQGNLRNFGWCVASAALLMTAFTISPSFRGVVAGALNRDATLTDRTLIWDAALNSGSNPIIGEGFESYWLSGKGSKIEEEFHVQYAHSGYLDKYLDTGLIGLALFIGMLWAAGRNAASHLLGGSSLGYIFMSLFWCSLLFNYTEVSFGQSNVFGMIVSLMVVYGRFVPSANPVGIPFRRDVSARHVFVGS